MFVQFSAPIHPMSWRLLLKLYGDEQDAMDAVWAILSTDSDGWFIIPADVCRINKGRINNQHFRDGESEIEN